jgi:hypothetical protein
MGDRFLEYKKKPVLKCYQTKSQSLLNVANFFQNIYIFEIWRMFFRKERDREREYCFRISPFIFIFHILAKFRIKKTLTGTEKKKGKSTLHSIRTVDTVLIRLKYSI